MNRLYAIALNGGHPFVFCTCCSGKFLNPGERDDTLFIPIDGSDDTWLARVGDARMIYLQKTTECEPAKSYSQACFMVFRHNPNAGRFFRASPVRRWIVFGNGFELCIRSAIDGVLEAGCEVWLIDDCFVQSARGYGISGTPEGRATALRELSQKGVKQLSLDEFAKWYHSKTAFGGNQTGSVIRA